MPNFPDNATPALGQQPGQVAPSSLNYVSLGAAAAPVATAAVTDAPATGAGTTATTAAVSPGTTGATVPAATTVATAAINPATASGAASPASPAVSAEADGDASGLTIGEQPLMAPSALSGNGTASTSGTPTPGTTAAASADAASARSPDGASAPAEPKAQDGDAGAPKTAKVGSAGITVPSANGPLDVYVVDGGVNVKGRGRAAPRSR